TTARAGARLPRSARPPSPGTDASPAAATCPVVTGPPAGQAGQCQGWVETASVRPAAARTAGDTSPAARAYPAWPVPAAAKAMPETDPPGASSGLPEFPGWMSARTV